MSRQVSDDPFITAAVATAPPFTDATDRVLARILGAVQDDLEDQHRSRPARVATVRRQDEPAVDGQAAAA